MTYPAGPMIQTSYTAFQTSQGDNSFPGVSLDTDLANVKNAIEGWIAFQKQIQRADGALANRTVNREQLGPGITIGLEPPVEWVTETAFAPPQTVYHDLGFYIARSEHTSGNFSDDLDAGYWEQLIDFYDATAAQEATAQAEAAAASAVGAATAQTAAEAAQAAAEAAAGTIVDQATVPIYGTKAVIAATDVPAGMLAVRTNGAAAADGPGGAFYQKTTGALGPGGVVDSEGKKFNLAAEQAVSDAMFASTADRDAFLDAGLSAARKLYGFVYHPARGVRISEFAKSRSGFVDQLDRVQEMFDVVLNDTRIFGADLEHVQVMIEGTLQVDHALLPGATRFPKTIANGTLIANGTAWLAGAVTDAELLAARSKPMVRHYHSAGGVMQRWNYMGVNFRGAAGDVNGIGKSSAVFIDGGYSSFRFRFCEFINPAVYAIRTRQGVGETGQNLRLEFCDVISPHPSTLPFEDRELVAFDLWYDGDCKFTGLRVLQAKIALRGVLGGPQLSNCHFFQGRSGTGPFSGNNPTIQLGANPNLQMTGCYVDNGHIELYGGLHGEPKPDEFGYLQIANTRFTNANSAADVHQVVIRPNHKGSDDGGVVLRNITMTGGEHRVIGPGTQKMLEPFHFSNLGGGSQKAAQSVNINVKDNNFWGNITPQASRIDLHGSTASSPVDINLAGKTAFGLQVIHGRVSTVTDTDSRGRWRRTGAQTGQVIISGTQSGSYWAELDCSSKSLLDPGVVV